MLGVAFCKSNSDILNKQFSDGFIKAYKRITWFVAYELENENKYD